jgi:hypothetical protein
MAPAQETLLLVIANWYVCDCAYDHQQCVVVNLTLLAKSHRAEERQRAAPYHTGNMAGNVRGAYAHARGQVPGTMGTTHAHNAKSTMDTHLLEITLIFMLALGQVNTPVLFTCRPDFCSQLPQVLLYCLAQAGTPHQ